MNISYKKIQAPAPDNSGKPVILSDKTFDLRLKKVLDRMEDFGISSLVVYADKEHGSNFEYLTGFIPRFEEALQIINKDGTSSLMLGNENFNKTKFARVKSSGVKVPLFSLPNQPMGDFKPFISYLDDVKIDDSGKIGFVDWKLLSPEFSEKDLISAVPHFIIEAFSEKYGRDKLVNASHLYLDPGYGARATNSAEEIVRYEYGASLASDALLAAYDNLAEGKSELEIGDILNKDGQYQSVVTIAAFGDRFVGANIYPTEKTLKENDKVSLTVAYKGGLSSRAGYAAKNLEGLEKTDPGYLEEVVVPYFKAYVYWLENVKIGKIGGEFYDDFNKFYPQEKYGWELNPGHLTADEEWLSSPFYKGSDRKVKSGMIFQVDFIPNQAGHQGVSAESTVAIADESLRKEIEENYPDLWARIEKRRAYTKENLNIDLDESLLPMASTLAYLRPFMLDKETALVVED
ncbi:Xaa-Pro peptidase family protein [uncultured Anaerococcus sp.]|uniref:M24 family metallopeptidase n=1 Tax=uncultured Anaerococcus sp. TaxID=293428 RepID=UPI0025F59E7A|nr:aminopeptidase P family protein [uncultured Anaerococcus sp.]